MPNLTVTTKEHIVLQGRQQGSTRTMTFANIVDVFNRIYSFKQQTLICKNNKFRSKSFSYKCNRRK